MTMFNEIAARKLCDSLGWSLIESFDRTVWHAYTTGEHRRFIASLEDLSECVVALGWGSDALSVPMRADRWGMPKYDSDEAVRQVKLMMSLRRTMPFALSARLIREGFDERSILLMAENEIDYDMMTSVLENSLQEIMDNDIDPDMVDSMLAGED